MVIRKRSIHKEKRKKQSKSEKDVSEAASKNSGISEMKMESQANLKKLREDQDGEDSSTPAKKQKSSILPKKNNAVEVATENRFSPLSGGQPLAESNEDVNIIENIRLVRSNSLSSTQRKNGPPKDNDQNTQKVKLAKKFSAPQSITSSKDKEDRKQHK